MKRSFLIFSLLILSTCLFFCTPKELNFFNGSLDEAFLAAQKQDKFLFVISSNGDCLSCDNFLAFLKREQVIKSEMADDFILYNYNMKAIGNEYLYRIFYNVGAPTTYIFSPKGTLKDIIVGNKNPEETLKIIREAKKGTLSKRDYHSRLNIEGASLLSFYNKILSSWKIYETQRKDKVKLKEALDSLNESLHQKEYFFNHYLAAKVYNELGDTTSGKIHAKAALAYYSNFDLYLYQPLRTELKFIANENYKASNEADMVFDKTLHNYNVVPIKDRPKAIFTFKNKGKTPLQIFKAFGNCDCMTISWSKKPIMPNQTGTVEVIYHADKEGSFSKAIFVISNAVNAQTILNLKGIVD